MRVLVRMALRNLFAHKAKSLIVGSIIALRVIVLVAGISFMDTAAVGLRRSFIENFTGDVIITGNAAHRSPSSACSRWGEPRPRRACPAARR